MAEPVDTGRAFEYENGFYAAAGVGRFAKFVTHLDLFRRSQGVPGEIVECGVFKGNSLFRFIKFRALLENTFSRRVIGFDTFGAFPAAEFAADRPALERFTAAAGPTGRSVEEISALLAANDLAANVELVAGDIRQTLIEHVTRYPELRISLLHIDVDLYEATRCALEVLFPHVSPGGILILDDYGAFAGANKAADEFFADRPERIVKLPYSNAISFVEKA